MKTLTMKQTHAVSGASFQEDICTAAATLTVANFVAGFGSNGAQMVFGQSMLASGIGAGFALAVVGQMAIDAYPELETAIPEGIAKIHNSFKNSWTKRIAS